MLRYAAISLLVALIAFVFVFFANMLVVGVVWVAKAVLFISLVLFAVFFCLHLLKSSKNKTPKSDT